MALACTKGTPFARYQTGDTQHANHRRGDVVSMTLTTLDDWAAELRLSASDATIRAYIGAVTTCCRHAGVTNPEQLTRAHVIRWLGDSQLSSNTRALYYRRMRAYARWANRPDLLSNLPAPAYRHPPVRVLSDQDMTRMINACCGADDVALLLLSVLGLRRAEAARIHGQDVTATHLQIVGKGGRVERLPMTTELRQIAAVMPTAQR